VRRTLQLFVTTPTRYEQSPSLLETVLLAVLGGKTSAQVILVSYYRTSAFSLVCGQEQRRLNILDRTKNQQSRQGCFHGATYVSSYPTHDRNAVPIENASKNSVSSNIPSAASESKYAHVQSGVRNMIWQVAFASHAMRGARQSCERLLAHPVVIAECSYVVSASILLRSPRA